jgi:Do/DeqQ family serine protease
MVHPVHKIRWILVAGVVSLLAAGPAVAQESRRSGAQVLQGIQSAFRDVSRKVLPTVVEIDVVDIVQRRIPEARFPFNFFFFGPQDRDPQGRERAPQDQERGFQERQFRQQGLGSGVIVRRSGNNVYVLTNNHVVGEADEIRVKLNDQRQFEARLVGKDERKDLALVVFETREQVPVAELGDSDSLEVGDLVLAVGNPLGFASTVTMGIVSATGREPVQGSDLAGFTDYIQTDAAINQGNSGGALVNIDGQVVGLNTWIASPSGGNIGLGFAIPINNARKAIDDFIDRGKVEYGWLGVQIGDLSADAARDLELENTSGAFVFSVFQDSPADKAGLQPGDLVVRIGGTPIRSSSQLLQTVGNLAPGASARFEVVRLGQRTSLQVRIASRPEEKQVAEQSKKAWPGMFALSVTEDMRRQLELPAAVGGVAIVSVEQGSAAAVAGFRPGDIIRTVNGKEVRSLLDFYRLINERGGRETMFKLYRQGNEISLGLSH